MKNFTRRDVCVALPAVAATSALAQVHASESPMPQSTAQPSKTVPTKDAPAPRSTASSTLGAARVIAFDQMPTRNMANGGESRDIAHGVLATGEVVNLHQSMQVAGAVPNPAHVIQHTEFIFVHEGKLEFSHEVADQMVMETAGPGSVIYVAFGTKHAVKNVGTGPARYLVVAIGGDAK